LEGTITAELDVCFKINTDFQDKYFWGKIDATFTWMSGHWGKDYGLSEGTFYLRTPQIGETNPIQRENIARNVAVAIVKFIGCNLCCTCVIRC